MNAGPESSLVPAVKQRLIAVYLELGSCNGCEMAIARLGPLILEIEKYLHFAEIRLLKQGTYDGPIDLLFVEGAVTTDEEIVELRAVASRAKRVVAIGTCAHIGGIPSDAPGYAIDAARAGKYGAQISGQGPIHARPIAEYVHVDTSIRGCPPDHQELVRIFRVVLGGGRPMLWTQPVCIECKKQGNPCLIMEGLPCLGPVTNGGCQAICTTAGDSCFGCRGFVNGPQHDALRETIIKWDIPLRSLDELYDMANYWTTREGGESLYVDPEHQQSFNHNREMSEEQQ